MAAMKTVAFPSTCSRKVCSILQLSPNLRNKYSMSASRSGRKYVPSTLISHSRPVFNIKVSRSSTKEEEDHPNMPVQSGASRAEITLSARIIQFLNLPVRLLPLTITIFTLPWKHGEQGTWAAVGTVIVIWNSIVLKKLINQPRPTSALGLRADPGMPSSHAQCYLYITTYGALALIHSQGLHLFTVGLGAIIILFGVFVAWLRVLKGVHAYSQVTVGAILGFLMAITWQYLWKIIELNFLSSFNKVRILLHIATLIVLLKITF